jgi:hypothetical protein
MSKQDVELKEMLKVYSGNFLYPHEEFPLVVIEVARSQNGPAFKAQYFAWPGASLKQPLAQRWCFWGRSADPFTIEGIAENLRRSAEAHLNVARYQRLSDTLPIEALLLTYVLKEANKATLEWFLLEHPEVRELVPFRSGALTHELEQLVRNLGDDLTIEVNDLSRLDLPRFGGAESRVSRVIP